MTIRTERLALMLTPGFKIEEPLDPTTWTIDGNPLDGEQLELMRWLKTEDIDELHALLALDLEMLEAELRKYRKRREQYENERYDVVDLVRRWLRQHMDE